MNRCDEYCDNHGCNRGPGCPAGGGCHSMPGCKDEACPGHPGPVRQALHIRGWGPAREDGASRMVRAIAWAVTITATSIVAVGFAGAAIGIGYLVARAMS
ncbi:MAG: hypothetical protein RL375_936 [Pseudomonadota bacterium]